MSVGTPFHPRTEPHNRKMQWREWSGYFAASVYADFHDIEYNAIREQAALIDVSPLYKYEVRGRDAERLVDRVITRDATKLKVGQVYYTPVVRRGRQGRRRRHDPSPGPQPVPLDGGRPAVPLADAERGRSRRGDRGHQRVDRRGGPPGAAQPGRPRGGDRRELRRPALLPAARRDDRGHRHRRQPDRLHRRPGLRAVGRGRAGGRAVGRGDGGGQAVRHPAGRDDRPRRRPPGGRPDPARGRLHQRPPRDEQRAGLLTG